MSETEKPVMVCNFCSKDQYQVRLLIACDSASICNECVGACATVVLDYSRNNSAPAKDDAA